MTPLKTLFQMLDIKKSKSTSVKPNQTPQLNKTFSNNLNIRRTKQTAHLAPQKTVSAKLNIKKTNFIVSVLLENKLKTVLSVLLIAVFIATFQILKI